MAVYASRVAEQDYREREPRDRRNKMLVMIFHKLVKQKTYVLNVAIIITTVAQRVFLNFMRFIALHMKFQLCCNF